MKTYLLAGVVLAGVAVQAARLTQSARQHLERAHLVTAEMHQRLLAEEEANPLMAAVWSTTVPDSEMGRAKTFHVNRWVSLWAVQYRTGVLAAESLAGYANNGMQNPAFLNFWEAARTFRLAGARDDVDRKFNAIVEHAYQSHRRKESEPAT